MENFTAKQYRTYIEKLSNAIGLDSNSEVNFFEFNPELEKQFFENIKKNSFLGLINVFSSTLSRGNCLGLNVPMPSTTDTDTTERSVERGFITPFQEFECTQLNLDSYVNYAKLDAFTQLEGCNFIDALNKELDQQQLTALLMAGWNGIQRSKTSNPNQNNLAQDTAKGWLQRIRDNAAGKMISQPQTYASKAAIIKAGLAKIGEPYKSNGSLVAICGRGILSDEALNITSQDLTEPNRIIIAQKTMGGLKAIYCPYFPENTVLISRLDNLSLYVHSGTIRKHFETVPAKDRLEVYMSMSVDFIVEDYNGVALIENATISE